MTSDGGTRVIHKRDVPWHRNGIVMKYVFMLAGLSIVFGAFVDPTFADARPGLIDVLVGLVLGNMCGWTMGKLMVQAFERDTIDGLNLWQETRRRSFDPRKLAYAGLFLVAAPGTGVISAYLSSVFDLGYPWVGKVELLSIGGVCMGMVFYMIAMARAVERWYRSLPD